MLFFLCALLLLLSITTSYKKSLLKYSISIVSFAKVRKYSRYLFYFSFIIGTLALVLYVRSLGGLMNAIKNAEYLRSFANHATDIISYGSALMKMPSALVTVSPLFYALWIENKRKWSIKNKIVFISLLLINIPYLLINAGKSGIFLFLLPIVLTLLSYRTKHEWGITLLCCLFGVSLINVLDLLFMALANDSVSLADIEVETDFSLLHQFAYPISNALNMREILQISELKFFKDFITGFLTHVPGLDFESSYVPTSTFYGGRWWRDGGVMEEELQMMS